MPKRKTKHSKKSNKKQNLRKQGTKKTTLEKKAVVSNVMSDVASNMASDVESNAEVDVAPSVAPEVMQDTVSDMSTLNVAASNIVPEVASNATANTLALDTAISNEKKQSDVQTAGEIPSMNVEGIEVGKVQKNKKSDVSALFEEILEKELAKDRKRIKRKSKKANAKSETRVPLWTKIVIFVLSLIIVLMIAVAIFGYMLLSHTANVFKGNPMDILIGTELAKDENNLTNVLIFGTSEDAEGHGGELLTDSILVASINQEKRTSKIFSIPRDLWVNYTVPGGDTMNCVVGTQGKINATYMCALNEYKNNKDQASRYFARKISEITGLNLQYYMTLDWSALKTVVDELGGIDVDVYADDENGIHDSCQHLDLPRGMNYGLNGSQALKLARARNAGCDDGGDFGLSRSNFDREINQQRIFNAIKNKAFSVGILSKPTKVIRLIDSLGNNVKTNITMAEVRTLIDVSMNLEGEVQSIPTVDQFGVGRIGVQSVVLPQGASVYNMSSLFNYGDFQRYLRKMLLD